MPENAPSISQGYRPQRIELSGKNTSSIHEGIDIIAKAGMPVIAPAAGIVIRSYFEPFYGSRVEIDHGKDENGMFIKSRYFHLRKRLVKKEKKLFADKRLERWAGPDCCQQAFLTCITKFGVGLSRANQFLNR